MALYAANNICQAVKNFEDRGYAHVGGVILNHRNVPGETEKVYSFAKEHGITVIAENPRSDDINECEDMGHTAVESRPECKASQHFLELAKKLIGEEK
jgi:nitrogenase iron protein NifH